MAEKQQKSKYQQTMSDHSIKEETQEAEKVGFDELLKAMQEADEITDHPECSIDNPECENCGA